MKTAFVTLSALLVVTFFAACNGEEGASPSAVPSPTVAASPSVTVRPTVTPTPVPNVCLRNPDPATANVLVVDRPLPNTSVISPVTVSGRIVAFEAQFNITIFDTAGGRIADVPARSQEGQVLSPFSQDVAFSVSTPKFACIWVYDLSPRDGSPINVVQVPLLLLPGPTATGSPSLKPADAPGPVAGACASPPAGDVVTITINADVPSPRCSKILPAQRVRVANGTNGPVRVQLARFDVTLPPGSTETFDAPVGTYLAPGVHFVWASQYPGSGGAELWLADQ